MRFKHQTSPNNNPTRNTLSSIYTYNNNQKVDGYHRPSYVMVSIPNGQTQDMTFNYHKKIHLEFFAVPLNNLTLIEEMSREFCASFRKDTTNNPRSQNPITFHSSKNAIKNYVMSSEPYSTKYTVHTYTGRDSPKRKKKTHLKGYISQMSHKPHYLNNYYGMKSSFQLLQLDAFTLRSIHTLYF